MLYIRYVYYTKPGGLASGSTAPSRTIEPQLGAAISVNMAP